MSANRRKHQRATLAGAVVGIVIISTFVISLIDPGGRRNRTSSNETLYTVTPYGTPPPPTEVVIPTPDPDPRLSGEPPYIHNSGYFQTFFPAGNDWQVDDYPAADDASRLSVVFQSLTRLVVIHTFIQRGIEYETLESLSENYLTPAYYAAEWSAYDSWIEVGRQVGDGRVTVSFNLVSQGHDYLGRDITQMVENRALVARLVVPANNAPLLDLLESLVLQVFREYPDIFGLPESWPIYADQQLGYLIKHPSGWRWIAGDAGLPTTFTVTEDDPPDRLRLWTASEQPLASADEAEAWLLAEEPTSEILSIQPVEREYGTGFQIGYGFQDAEGDQHSGLVTLLNDENGTLYVANLYVMAPGLNLLQDEDLSPTVTNNCRAVVQGFILLPPESRATAQ